MTEAEFEGKKKAFIEKHRITINWGYEKLEYLGKEVSDKLYLQDVLAKRDKAFESLCLAHGRGLERERVVGVVDKMINENKLDPDYAQDGYCETNIRCLRELKQKITGR